ncbi:class I SAM-dependent methyltransferase [Burkholderia pyrrocinia]|uniref:class I SAM-dependent methyltransferase n=1 Tax=Burkholderia pyrrocinia TaxID=60550 RepID=UPI002AB0A165|nr:methyltransferase domain-containing protein [Burkholderia pyrrocinia]
MDRRDFYEVLAKAGKDHSAVYRALRSMPIDVVADLLNHVPPEYADVRAAIPSMAPDDVQISWTGSSGYPLLMQSCAFVRALESGYRRLNDRGLDDAQILDFGCGWGRLIRLMYKFTAPENIYGCDPWARSIELCRESNVRANLSVSDYLPSSLPFADATFDLIYSFSVFTHLSERAATAAISACRKSIKKDGMMVITVRPLSYWDYHDEAQNKVDREQMKQDHAARGFAYTPHDRQAIDGDITYGDTSISLDYIRTNWQDWKVAGTDYFLQDPFQMLVFLKPR